MGGVIYLLDTNILSEPIKKRPNQNVMTALERYQGQWATSSIVWRELYYGWKRLPNSKRKREVGRYMEHLGNSSLEILPFDRRAAEWLGVERGRLEKAGLTPSYVDSEIAAIAITQKLTLVTRNLADFKSFSGLQLDNWF
ncbi:MAG: type II toxin-antitoxin system VapC family toxin [Thermodesulfobacteriota bacterium]|nr:type II toxin-antitoxin system VapC family toxin [Thermodesulfobacteriota bacterium]